LDVPDFSDAAFAGSARSRRQSVSSIVSLETTMGVNRENKKHSRLFYFGTDIEVEIGDRILWKRFWRRSREGKVVYIPGLCPKHPDLDFEGIGDWAFQLNDGTVYQSVYDPQRSQPKRDIRFLGRSEAEPLSPDVPLH
jgi:hypothetical protein